MQHTTSVLSTLLKHLTPLPYPNIIGIELLNEPAPPSDPALQKWYTDTIKALRNVNPNMPIYIGECWRPKEYSRFADTLPAQPGSSGFLIVDHHLYRCFTKEDIHTPASQHAYNVAKSPGALAECGTSIVIGEWSGALNPGSLSGSLNHIEQQRNFVIAELELIEKYAGGSFFWTFKKEQAGDTGWSLRDAVGAGTFPDFLGLRARRDWSKDGEGREERKEGERTKASSESSPFTVERTSNRLRLKRSMRTIGTSSKGTTSIGDSTMGSGTGGMLLTASSRRLRLGKDQCRSLGLKTRMQNACSLSM